MTRPRSNETSGEESTESKSRRKREQLRFIATFLILITSLYLLIALRPVDEAIVTPFSRMVTVMSATALNLAGQGVIREGTIIRSSRFAVDVKNGCNGIEAVLLVLSAIVAFPATWRQRALGMIVVASLVQAFNIVRVSSLYIIGRDYPTLFDAAHVTVWQSIMFLVSIGLFMAWSSRVAKRREVSA